MKRERGATLIVAALIGLCPSSGEAQRLADWPVRISALPDAVATGASAAFWNPAGLGIGVQKTEALVLLLHTPQILELSGLAAATAVKFQGTTVAAAYKHIGVDGFTRTEDSPAGETFDIGEDHFSLAAAQALGQSFSVGAMARYARDNLDETDPIVGVGAGLGAELDVPLPARLGVYALNEDGTLLWGAGAEVRLPPLLGPSSNFAIAYGVQRDVLNESPIHRVAAELDWATRVWVSAGVSREPDGNQTRWAPILAASLRLNRYTLGVVRESLARDFGATYAARLQVNFGAPRIGLSQ
jgi:hypothetical protein